MGEQSLARMIKKRRETLGFSQARLGELVGRSASTIRNWERGKSTPSSVVDAVALAAVLGLEEGEVVEAAGFQVDDVPSHQTVEQAYASLAPTETEPGDDPEPVPERFEPVERDPDEQKSEEEAVPPSQQTEPEGEEVPEQPAAVSPPPQGTTSGPPEPRPASPPPGRRLQPVRVDAPPAADQADDEAVERAAPPTVLETAPREEPSYVEDPEERQRYRIRAFATAAVVLFLVIMLFWSVDRVMDAAGGMWQDFTGMLEI